MTSPFIHPLSDVQSSSIGTGTRLWQFVVVLPGTQIGQDCNNSHVIPALIRRFHEAKVSGAPAYADFLSQIGR